MISAIHRSIIISASAVCLLCVASFGDTISPSRPVVFEEKAVSKKVLGNGLTILAQQSQPGDLVAIDIAIRAGSSLQDGYPASGIAHFVEHMIFKGTKSRKVGDVEREVKSFGGSINGSVSYDLTHYNLIVPAKYFDKAILLLKDILLNATFEKTEFSKEQEVILNEIRLNNDDPERKIFKLLSETAYIRHPYKYPPIGYEDTFKSLNRDDLVRYCDRMYVPDRMVISVVGGIPVEDTFRVIESGFKDFRRPSREDISAGEQEPRQLGTRRGGEEASINLAYLALGYHSTDIFNEDLFAMDVASMILGRGDNSRLNERLFKKERVVHTVSCWNHTPRDPGIFVITAILDRDKSGAAESLIMDEIGKLRTGTISDDELEAAKRMVVSDYIFSRQTIESQANDLSSNEALTGNYDFSYRYVRAVQAVSKEDIRRVADKYLRDANLTVVRLMPEEKKGPATAAAPLPAAEPAIDKKILPNGLRLILREDHKTPTVSVTVAMLGGLWAETAGNNGISNLSGRMLLKGTTSRNESEIAGAIEKRGGTVTAFSSFNSFGLTVSALSDDIDNVLDILKDILANSIFPPYEVEKEKTLVVAMIADEDDDIFARGSNALRKELFGKHPYGLRVYGEESSVMSLKKEDIAAFVHTYAVPNNMVLSISGDINSNTVMKKLESLFGTMKNKDLPAFPQKPSKLGSIKTESIDMDREESLVLIGFETSSIKDPDRYAFEVLGSILSGSSGRLFHDLRDSRSLAYALGCTQKFCSDSGYFIFYVATSKDNIGQSRSALADEIKQIRARPVTSDELTMAKRELVSGHKVAMQTNEFFSFQSALDELRGLGHDALCRYESNIEKVTQEDLKRIAEKYFDLDAYAEAIVRSQTK